MMLSGGQRAPAGAGDTKGYTAYASVDGAMLKPCLRATSMINAEPSI
jgi:hypothetical protein